MPREQWLPVPGWPAYEVSSHGRVRRLGMPGVLAQRADGHGYLTVTLSDSPRRKTARVHVLVAEAFLGPRPPGLQIRHLDSRSWNCAVSNLAYGTAVENAQDRRRVNKNLRGRKQGSTSESDAGWDLDGPVTCDTGSARRASSPAQTPPSAESVTGPATGPATGQEQDHG